MLVKWREQKICALNLNILIYAHGTLSLLLCIYSFIISTQNSREYTSQAVQDLKKELVKKNKKKGDDGSDEESSDDEDMKDVDSDTDAPHDSDEDDEVLNAGCML